MKHIVEAGTDAASLLLFDPLTLPEDFDVATHDGDSTETLNDLHDQGRLFWINTGGDGRFLLHAFIEEEISAELQPFLRDPEASERFTISSGQIYFMGAEYGFRIDDSAFRRYPGMGDSFPVENGTYCLTLYRTEYPDGIHAERFRQRSTWTQQVVHGTFNVLMAGAILAVIVGIIALFTVTWTTWFNYFLPVVAVAIVLPILLRQLPTYQIAETTWRTVNNELPSMVAMLARKTG